MGITLKRSTFLPSLRLFWQCCCHDLCTAEKTATSRGCSLCVVFDGSPMIMIPCLKAMSRMSLASCELWPSTVRTIGLASSTRAARASGTKTCSNHSAVSSLSVHPLGELAMLGLTHQYDSTGPSKSESKPSKPFDISKIWLRTLLEYNPRGHCPPSS